MKKTIGCFIVSVGILIFGSCSKSNDTLPAIDGYNNSNEVASANLVAHWTFDDTKAEAISGKTPLKDTASSFTTGVLGKALSLDSGVLVYPTIDKINTANALNSFTVSLWVKVTNNKGTERAGFSSFFSLIPTTVSDVWPDFTACAETAPYRPVSDTLQLKALYNTHPLAGGNSLQDNVAVFNNDPADGTHPDGQTGSWFMGAKTWVHFTISYDGPNSLFKIYANGVSVGGYNHRGTTGILIMAVPVKAVFGSIAWKDLGGFPSAPTRGFNPRLTGSVDDVRVFNTLLAQKDITALYHLGVAGR